MRALLRGDELPAKLEELRRPLVSVIDELATEVGSSFDDSATSALRQRLLTDGSQTLAIMGQRGSGKSTLLAAVSTELDRHDRHLVMPIMRPDLFSETDSVITTFLAELWDAIALRTRHELTSTPEADLGEYAEAIRLLTEAARGFAVARTTTAALEHGTDSPMDFAEDFLTVSRSGVRLTLQLRQLAKELCVPSDSSSEARLIVVPIDDPDLTRHNIIDILTDMQILGSVPGIVPLTCFSPDDLNTAWVTARRRLLADAPEKHLQFLLARQMEKVFPYRFRFEIEPLAATQRADFTPIAGTMPLREKLSALKAKVESVSNASWAIDEALTVTEQTFGLPNALPDNARTLVQLWETLDSSELPASEQSSTEMLHLTLRRFLNIMSERAGARLGKATSALVQIGPPLAEAPSKRTAHADFGSFPFFTSASEPEFDPTESSIAYIHLRSLHQVQAVTPLAKKPSRGGDYSAEDYLTGEELASLLVLQEIVLGTGLFEATGNRLFVGRDEWRFLQHVYLANQPTDDVFLLLPEASTLSEVLRSASLWNDLTTLTESAQTETIMATCIVAACLTVQRDQELRRVNDYDKAFDQACEMYKYCLGRAGSTPKAFIEWFERDLPLQWHSALLGVERIRTLASRHQEIAKQRASSNYAEDIDSSLFDVRLRTLLDGLEQPDGEDTRFTWVAGYFELASALGSDQVDRLSRLYPRWLRDSAGVRAGAITVGTVTRVPARARAAPFPTPEGTELLTAGLAALKRARSSARTEFRSH